MTTYTDMNDGSGWIIRDSDGATFKGDPGNPDYKQYLKDIEEGAVVTDFDWAAHNAKIAQEEADKLKQAEEDAVKEKLMGIDIKSIRSIREYLAAKSDAPQFLKDYEVQATTERAKLKKE